MSMTAEDLYKTQAALEGLCFNDSGYLVRFKDMPGESGPPFRVVAADFRSRKRVYFGAGISPDLENELRRLPVQDLLSGTPGTIELLYPAGGDAQRAEYCTYTWDMTGLPAVSPRVQTLSTVDERLRETSGGFFGNDYHRVFAVVMDGMVASAAVSSREDSRSAELGLHQPAGAPSGPRQASGSKLATKRD